LIVGAPIAAACSNHFVNPAEGGDPMLHPRTRRPG
jgi:hypothetical protein